MDDSQDTGVVSSLENGTHTIMSVMRYLDTTDSTDYLIKVMNILLYVTNSPSAN